MSNVAVYLATAGAGNVLFRADEFPREIDPGPTAGQPNRVRAHHR